MTTERQRLKAWMEANGHDAKSLQKALGMAFRIKFLDGGWPINDGFRYRFADTFGDDTLLQITGVDVSDRVAQCAAQQAVAAAMYKGTLPRAKEFICQSCGKQAHSYHHPSYRRDSRLCVVPLCAKCHQRHHKSNMPLPHLGIVARPIGIIRIAIAGL